MTKILCLAIVVALLFFLTGCDVLFGTVPSSDGESASVLASTGTPLPTLGELEPLDAAYCMESAPDAHEKEYSVLRFFESGVVLQVTVEGRDSCEETWDYIKSYLKETATNTFSHGEYQYSKGQIRFSLAPPGSDEMAGEVTGRIEEDKMILQQQGTEMIYVLVYGGN